MERNFNGKNIRFRVVGPDDVFPEQPRSPILERINNERKRKTIELLEVSRPQIREDGESDLDPLAS